MYYFLPSGVFGACEDWESPATLKKVLGAQGLEPRTSCV